MKIGRKEAKHVSIIGGADGPTAVFFAGRTGKRSLVGQMKHRIRNRKYEKRRKAAVRQIQEGRHIAHTVEETLQYIRKTYQAVEAEESYLCYAQRRESVRLSLLQRYRPELLGEEKPVLPPRDLKDRQAVEVWHRQVMEQIAERERRARAVSEDVFPVEYHLFLIDRGADGQLEIEVETLHGQLSCSYSGKKEQLEPILKEIYLYYGVSEDDIRQKTERYQMLEQVLSHK